jgi:hypothetical protein
VDSERELLSPKPKAESIAGWVSSEHYDEGVDEQPDDENNLAHRENELGVSEELQSVRVICALRLLS